MAKSLHIAEHREEITRRLRSLKPDAVRQWGRMSASQMLAHLVQSARMATGELAVGEKKSFIRFWPVKKLIIYVAPFPKSVPTAPELLARTPAEWSGEVDEVIAAIERVGQKPQTDSWPKHPIFGRMTHGDWGVLAYRHTDHHLRQFGA